MGLTGACYILMLMVMVMVMISIANTKRMSHLFNSGHLWRFAGLRRADHEPQEEPFLVKMKCM
jgi:hypothetical protein